MVATKPILKKPALRKGAIMKATAKFAVRKDTTQAQVSSRCPPKKEKPMKQIFEHLNMSFSGTFINLDKPVPHEQVVKWITAHGAEYEREVTSNTTHLICSIEDYEKKTAQGKCISGSASTQLIFIAVEKAWKLGPKCKIVVFDWIVDCLLGPKLKKGLRMDRGYTLDRTLKAVKKGKKALDAYRASFEQNVRIAEELCSNRK